MDRSTFSKSAMGALAYGIFSYGVFLAVFVYAVGFIGGFLTPTRLDGAPTRPFWQALAIDLGLLGLFAVQHSVMARPAFKRWWTRFVPAAVERSTYVLLSSARADRACSPGGSRCGGVVWDAHGRVARSSVIGALLRRLGAACSHHLPDRPLRPVRAAAGVAARCAAAPYHAAAILHAEPLQAGPPPALRRLADRSSGRRRR